MAVGGFCGGCCGGCTVQINVVSCSPTIPAVGAVVTVLSGMTVIATCTTNSLGSCTLTIPSAGTYTVTVTYFGSTVYSASRALACSSVVTIATAAVNYVCCGNAIIPYNLTATDAATSFPLTYYSGAFYPQWWGCVIVPRSSVTATTPGGVCLPSAVGTNNILVCYVMQCTPGNTPAFAAQRQWSWIVDLAAVPAWYSQGSGFPSCSTGITMPCSSGGPAACSPGSDIASATATPSSVSPFAISFALADNVSNATGDPIGGGLVVSA